MAEALAPASEAGEAPVAETSTPAEAAAPTPEIVPAVAKRAPSPPPLAARVEAKLTIKQLAAKSRKEAKQRKREKKIESFKDYFRHQEPLAKIPPHRALAINRGERSKILRVKIEADMGALYQRAEHRLIRADHPHAEFLRDCLRDALGRLLMPSLEREVRRELTEWAELHAVQVFARNLRQLLLQPPVRDRRVLAIDPGFRSGCKLAAMDEFGNVLGHTVIHVIGKDDIVRRGRQQVVEMVLMYHIPVIAIGNGTACREAERLIADIIAHELKDYDVQYAIVNEAGASVYSTSSVGREELPRFDPVLRSAVSIGRRLQDPLSELVKINPANIGVGLYQHDVKSKHLEESLDAVVESCVNFVGVDANTASPALLRYVSGLNQLTARRMYEYRQKHGPFRSRDQFRNVPGFGDAAFVQAAGFLKIIGGDNPLDATWIHPESYEIAQRVIEQLGGSEAELASQLSSRVMIAEVTRPEFGAGVAHVQPAEAEAAEVAEATNALSAQPAEDDALQGTPGVAAEEPVAETPVAESVGEPATVEPAAEPSAEPDASPPPATAAEPTRQQNRPRPRRNRRPLTWTRRPPRWRKRRWPSRSKQNAATKRLPRSRTRAILGATGGPSGRGPVGPRPGGRRATVAGHLELPEASRPRSSRGLAATGISPRDYEAGASPAGHGADGNRAERRRFWRVCGHRLAGQRLDSHQSFGGPVCQGSARNRQCRRHPQRLGRGR